jgi:periplasmic protein TonB
MPSSMSSAMSLASSKPSFFAANRNVVIAGGVLLFHALAIWALQTGLLMRAAEIIVPVEILAQMVELPAPKADRAPPKPPEPVKQVVSKPKQVTQVAPTLLAVADATPTPNAPSVQPITPPAPYVPAVPVAAVAAPAPPAPPAAPRIVLPSSDAAYLSNPKPPYPDKSNRLREEGTVRVRVLVSTEGLPLKVELSKSSGFERLDQSALDTVPKWKFVPGKRDGVAEDMWFVVPIPFSLIK